MCVAVVVEQPFFYFPSLGIVFAGIEEGQGCGAKKGGFPPEKRVKA